MRIITEAQWAILQEITISKDRTYQKLLSKSKVKSNKTLLASLKELEFLGLIRSKKVAGNGYRGRKATLFQPTINGLLVTLLGLSCQKELKENIDKIAENNKEMLPLIFGKWQFFQEHNVKDVTCMLLEAAVSKEAGQLLFWLEKRLDYLANLKKKLKKEGVASLIYKPEQFRKELEALVKFINASGVARLANSLPEELFKAGRQIEEVHEGLIIERVQKAFFFPVNFKSEDYARFLEACRQDRELSNYIAEGLKRQEQEHSQYLENIRSWLALFSKT